MKKPKPLTLLDVADKLDHLFDNLGGEDLARAADCCRRKHKLHQKRMAELRAIKKWEREQAMREALYSEPLI